ncbi:MAG TPA: thiamine pyrophosphate-binding protein [Dehalococcoidia bacterium]|jgi:acetolactate synthase-1/2/3 large subunit|nr:thiamine pyrophosphate-binding protein [Dehalococcoidia bacterium]HIK88148.1 thiamine pyrophosphate-binding protein [Dehalococcoidia bacterium]
MKFADLLMQDAANRGLKHVFGLPGSGFPMDAMEAGRKAGVEFVHIAHESSAAIAAAYYGAGLGTAGLAIGVKGVGAGNMVGGVTNAFFERMPVVCAFEAGETDSDTDLVQVTDHGAMFKGVTKSYSTLERSTANDTLRDAVGLAVDGRKGPVVIDYPSNFDDQDCGELPVVPAKYVETSPDAAALDEARKLIASSQNPMVIVGADVVTTEAQSELLAFVEAIGGAVQVNMDARGVFPESHPRFAGVMTGNYQPHTMEGELQDLCDLAILVGGDSLMTHAPWNFDMPVIELVSRPEYKTTAPYPEVRVDGSLSESLLALSSASGQGVSLEDIDSAKQNILKYFKRPSEAAFAIQDIVASCRESLPAEGVVISETGAFVRMLEHLWDFDRYGGFLGTSGGRTMGLMIPAALGAKMANPDVPMIGIGADGSTLMRLGELEVFARMNVAMPLVIVNDRALGTMKSRQVSRGLPKFGLDLSPVDFAAVARASGINGVIANTPEEFDAAIATAMAADKATVIDARIDQQPYWDNFALSIGAIPEA